MPPRATCRSAAGMRLVRRPPGRLAIPFLLLLAAVAGSGCGSGSAAPPDEAVALNDRGVAHMGRYEYAQAERLFAEAAALAPAWLDVRVNQAIATLNRQQEGDERLTLTILERVLADDPQHARALYTGGIVHLYLGEAAPAAALLERALERDPADAYTVYFLGQTRLQQGDHAAAAPLFLRAVELDPYLRSAYWAGAQALRRTGQGERANELLIDYQRFEAHPAARLAAFSYMKMGPKAEARAVTVAEAAPAPRPEGDLFTARVTVDERDWSEARLTTADIDGDGRLDLFASSPARTAVFLGSEGGFIPSSGHPLSAAPPSSAALWGDVDNDGSLDVVFCHRGGARLWGQTEPGAWAQTDVAVRAPCAAGALFDADHDGDLDIFVTGAEGSELLSNNLDGSFRALADEMGLRGGAGRQVIAADLDHDRDLDIVVLNREPPHDVWRNDRTWRYDAMPGFDDLRRADLSALTVADADADGRPEFYGASGSQLTVWRTDFDGADGAVWRPDAVAAAGAAGILDAADFDGDARPDLLAAGGDGFALIETGSGRTIHADATPVDAVVRVPIEPGRGPALAAANARGLHLWPAGPGRHAFLAIAPTGRSEAEQMRSNASGIGTQVRVRFAGQWALLDALDANSSPGQSLAPLSVGLAGHGHADFVSLLWSDGVSQSELDLAAGELHAIAETQRQLASCPVLFAWNGDEYRFVSDMLGVAATGLFSEPGVTVPPRPFETFLLTPDQLAARDGRYRVKLGEPMEEAAYIDAARLSVYDLPPGWEMALDERQDTNPPAVTGRPITWRADAARSPLRVTDASGDDVTDLAARADRRAPSPGARDPRFIGLLASEQVLTLEFGAPLPERNAVLVAESWTEYPYSQTVFAAWQAGLRYRPATLEARAGDGAWQVVAREFGFPAGMPRTIALPLPPLPADTDALRLRSNMEIYWDRIRIVREEPLPGLAPIRLAPALARIARTGFARRTTGEQRLPHYDYGDRATYWDARVARGFYTSLGDATELVADEDGALAIFGSGEEIHVEFPEAPPPSPGATRRFGIEFRGWARDMDLYTRHGDTLEPLPRRADVDPALAARARRLNERYNIRFQEGL